MSSIFYIYERSNLAPASRKCPKIGKVLRKLERKFRKNGESLGRWRERGKYGGSLGYHIAERQRGRV